MKLNENTRIIGQKVILVPYRKHHVVKYHEWMESKEIQDLTSSEPLSLEEEFDMQTKWQNDPDKLTFIVLRKDLYESSKSNDNQKKEIESMIGDVNCFVYADLDDENKYLSELEIMIVDKNNRGLGFGSESIRLMINYCLSYLENPKIFEFVVKITEENESSVNLFKKIGFQFSKKISVFNQIEYKIDVDRCKGFILSKDYLIDQNYFL